MVKEKNNISFLKKKYRKKSFLIRKQASTYIYDSSFNASKKIISFLKITPKDIIGCYWPINNELDTRPLISILSLKNTSDLELRFFVQRRIAKIWTIHAFARQGKKKPCSVVLKLRSWSSEVTLDEPSLDSKTFELPLAGSSFTQARGDWTVSIFSVCKPSSRNMIGSENMASPPTDQVFWPTEVLRFQIERN